MSSIKDRKFLHQLSTYQILKDWAPFNYVAHTKQSNYTELLHLKWEQRWIMNPFWNELYSYYPQYSIKALIQVQINQYIWHKGAAWGMFSIFHVLQSANTQRTFALLRKWYLLGIYYTKISFCFFCYLSLSLTYFLCVTDVGKIINQASDQRWFV